MLRTAQQIVIDALKAEVKERLAQCTEKQQAFFARIYPHGIDKMTEHELKNSIDLTGRTIRKNTTGEMYGRLPDEVASSR